VRIDPSIFVYAIVAESVIAGVVRATVRTCRELIPGLVV